MRVGYEVSDSYVGGSTENMLKLVRVYVGILEIDPRIGTVLLSVCWETTVLDLSTE